jgi:hypothetical protein
MFSKFATKLRKKGIFRAKNNLEIQETDRLNHILELNMKVKLFKITSVSENATISFVKKTV